MVRFKARLAKDWRNHRLYETGNFNNNSDSDNLPNVIRMRGCSIYYDNRSRQEFETICEYLTEITSLSGKLAKIEASALERFMSIFASHNVETMTEADVEGEIVRPFCKALGYFQGHPEANLRSQVTIRYPRAFLGHKNPKKDPPLVGKPDFVCEVVSYARWVIEAKKPSLELSLEDSEQAHTYATHPSIAAEFYILVNGREFRLYRAGNPEVPLWTWAKDDTDDLLPALRELLGPAAMKKRANVQIDKGKPLAAGIPSHVEIVGGHVTYEKNVSNLPQQLNMDGLVNSVRGTRVYRTDEGLIEAELDLKSAFAPMDEMFLAFGFYPLRFSTSDEYLSADADKPTLLQGLVVVDFPAGTKLPKTPLSPGGILPVRIKAECFTEAEGIIEGNTFKGVFTVQYFYEVFSPVPLPLPKTIEMRTDGTYEINFK
ncbi:type I restriction endonuclease subunit R [Neorhizobium sp. DT-125]|uniref:type I restriction endonuclease subunit R n=1 Tax=Neorhizobium sp. DT-125 TaxID=3396163 RepID=UPI003F1C2740